MWGIAPGLVSRDVRIRQSGKLKGYGNHARGASALNLGSMLLLLVKYLGRVELPKPIEQFLQLNDHFRRPGWVFGSHLG